MKKALVTGVTGFAGSFLAEQLLRNKSLEVIGTCFSDRELLNIEDIKAEIKIEKINLLDSKATEDLITSTKPDLIFHLAAISFPYGSLDDPAKTMTNNIISQINLLEAVRKKNIDPKILIISSGDIYGMVEKEDLPIDEETTFRPTTPYSVSKITQDFLGLQYHLAHNMKIIRARPFNHIGPRQAAQFVVPSFAKQIAEIEKGKREGVIRVGNLFSKRDFTDVRDMIEAYILALDRGKLGEVYNIGSGVAYKISDILEKLLSFSSKKIKIEIDETLIRSKDESELRCDCTKFTRLTGWEPKIPIEQSLKDTLDYWRNIL